RAGRLLLTLWLSLLVLRCWRCGLTIVWRSSGRSLVLRRLSRLILLTSVWGLLRCRLAVLRCIGLRLGIALLGTRLTQECRCEKQTCRQRGAQDSCNSVVALHRNLGKLSVRDFRRCVA